MDTKRLSQALRMGAFLYLGSENYDDGKRMAALFRDGELLGVANYAIAAPQAMRSAVVSVAAEQITAALGGESEFWKALMEWRNGEPLFRPDGEPTPAPQTAPTPAKAVPATVGPTPEELDRKYLEYTADLRQRLHKILEVTCWPMTKLHATLLEISKELNIPAPSYSALSAIRPPEVRTNTNRSIHPLTKEHVSTLFTRVEERFGITPTPSVTPVTQPQEASPAPHRVRVVPTDHRSRIAVLESFVKQHAGEFSLQDAGREISLEDEGRIYAVLRDVKGVQQVGNNRYRYLP